MDEPGWPGALFPVSLRRLPAKPSADSGPFAAVDPLRRPMRNLHSLRLYASANSGPNPVWERSPG